MYTFLFPWWWLMRNVCGKMIHSRAIPSQCCLGCLKLHLFISHHLVRPFIHLKRHGLYQDACKAHNSSVWPNPTIFREVPGSNLIDNRISFRASQFMFYKISSKISWSCFCKIMRVSFKYIIPCTSSLLAWTLTTWSVSLFSSFQ